MQPRLIEKYRVGGNYKTIGAHETRWQFGNHEIRVRVRRGNWQFYVSSGARVQGMYDPGTNHFPEWLDVRCPTMSIDQLGAVEAWIARVLSEDNDKRGFHVSNDNFLPRRAEYVCN